MRKFLYLLLFTASFYAYSSSTIAMNTNKKYIGKVRRSLESKGKVKSVHLMREVLASTYNYLKDNSKLRRNISSETHWDGRKLTLLLKKLWHRSFKVSFSVGEWAGCDRDTYAYVLYKRLPYTGLRVLLNNTIYVCNELISEVAGFSEEEVSEHWYSKGDMVGRILLHELVHQLGYQDECVAEKITKTTYLIYSLIYKGTLESFEDPMPTGYNCYDSEDNKKMIELVKSNFKALKESKSN